jgi:hypothetical protein
MPQNPIALIAKIFTPLVALLTWGKPAEAQQKSPHRSAAPLSEKTILVTDSSRPVQRHKVFAIDAVAGVAPLLSTYPDKRRGLTTAEIRLSWANLSKTRRGKDLRTAFALSLQGFAPPTQGAAPADYLNRHPTQGSYSVLTQEHGTLRIGADVETPLSPKLVLASKIQAALGLFTSSARGNQKHTVISFVQGADLGLKTTLTERLALEFGANTTLYSVAQDSKLNTGAYFRLSFTAFDRHKKFTEYRKKRVPATSLNGSE